MTVKVNSSPPSLQQSNWTILDLEKRIPMEVFEGFKRITLAGGYVLITTGWGMESASKVFLENDYPLGRDGYPHALAVAPACKGKMYCTPKVGQLLKQQIGDIFQEVQQGGA